MAVPTLEPSFTAGELAPALWGREDLAKLRIGATTLRNMYVSYRGGAYSRAGTAFVGRCKQPFGLVRARVIPFTFSVDQGYALEFGTQYMRVIFQGAYVTETPIAITSISNSANATMTVSGSFNAGDWIFIANLQGMTELNGETVIVGGAGGSSFPLLDLDGAPLNTLSFSPYIVGLSGGTAARIFTLATPYQAVDLPRLKYAQSADVMSLTHPSYAPMELRRLAADNWSLVPFTTASSIDPPATVSLVVNTAGTGNPTGYAYVVTATDLVTGQESIASDEARITSPIDISATAGSITITWSTVPRAAFYNVYRAPTAPNTQVPAGAVFGFLGQSRGTQFTDSNIVPDFTQSPPLDTNPFVPGQVLGVVVDNPGSGYTTFVLTINTTTGSGAELSVLFIGGALSGVIVRKGGQNYLSSDTITITGDGSGAAAHLTVGPMTGLYPSVVSYFQQRRVYANTTNNPDTMWFSQPGAFNNFDRRLPVIDSDAITASPFAEQVDGIQFMLQMSVGLVTLTGKAAWQIEGSGTSTFNPQPITPSSIEALSQAFNGCNPRVVPFRSNYDLLYVQSLGSAVRALQYNFYTQVYTGTDISILSTHLFYGYEILEWAWCEEPLKIAWAVRDDGALLSLTYLKEQEVSGWARHDTQGQFWSACSVSEPPVNAAYFVVSRHRPGKPSAFYVERMDNHIWASAEDCWCIDCGVATELTAPDVGLTIDAMSGPVTLTTTAAFFSAANVGEIVRAFGGIARITGFVNSTNVTGTWVKPANSPFFFTDEWTIAPQFQTVGGLGHLVGMTVIGLADGVPLDPMVVPSSGVVTLPFAASDIKIGLPFLPQFQSVYLDEGQPTIQGRRKNIFAVTARMDTSGGQISAGANQIDGSTVSPPTLAVAWSGLARMPALGATYQSPAGKTVTELYSGDIRVPIQASWAKPGQVALQQNLPLPMSILALVPEWLPGDLPELAIADRRGRQ